MNAVAKDTTAPLVVLIGNNKSGKTAFYIEMVESGSKPCVYFDHAMASIGGG